MFGNQNTEWMQRNLPITKLLLYATEFGIGREVVNSYTPIPRTQLYYTATMAPYLKEQGIGARKRCVIELILLNLFYINEKPIFLLFLGQ